LTKRLGLEVLAILYAPSPLYGLSLDVFVLI
jgi:hypothetical protein